MGSDGLRLVEYVVWFRDESLPPDDQDYEWPACFRIESGGDDEAKLWGDQLARSYAQRTGQVFLRSELTPVTPATELPVVRVGDEASDAKIGW